jgi:hypothetical protein
MSGISIIDRESGFHTYCVNERVTRLLRMLVVSTQYAWVGSRLSGIDRVNTDTVPPVSHPGSGLPVAQHLDKNLPNTR